MKNILENLGYEFDEATKVWAHPLYQSINYSDGDETENRLAEVLKDTNDLSVLSDELKAKCVDWVSTYHLSSARANILRPFDHLLNGKVLEIGAGCGAITRYLGESGAEILALEGSLRRASIAKLRTRDLDNVTVLAETFGDFKTTERFDVITLIGVLEYANLFMPGDEPAVSMLERVRSLLKPDGKLIIAIENQLGLKYFAGAPEDHLGIPMFGIENHYHKSSAKTFGKKALDQMLKISGFEDVHFLAPFPDYKLPVSIVTETGFKNKAFDASSFAWQAVGRDPNLSKNPNFSMELAWPQIFTNGLALDLANSFLIVASQSDASSVDPHDLAFHYNVGRVKEYCKETKFRTDGVNGEISVFNRRLKFDDSLSFNKSNEKLIYSLSPCDIYSYGEPVSQRFFQIIEKPGWTLSEVLDYIFKYIEILEGLLRQSGEEQSLISSQQVLPGGFFDALPQNIIKTSTGKFVLIDEEWTLSGGITLGHLLFRSLFWMLGHASTIAKSNPITELNRVQFIKMVLDASGIYLSDEDLGTILDCEIKIQHHISGTSPHAFFESLENQSILRLSSSEMLLQDGETIRDLRNDVAQTQLKLDSILNSKLGRLVSFGRAVKKKAKSPYYFLNNLRKFSKLKGGIGSIIKRSFAIYYAYGFSGLINALKKYGNESNLTFKATQVDLVSYSEWINQNNTISEADRIDIAKKIQEFKVAPLVSVLVPTYNANLKWLNEAIESIRNQIYYNWELCIVDDASTDISVRSFLKTLEEEDSRIKVVLRDTNGHISESSNSGLEVASGDWIALLDHDDLLPPDALYWVADAINNNNNCALIYSDEDKIDENGTRFDPYFKPDWNAELFYSQNLISHLGVYRADLMKKIGGFRKGLEGSQDYDLALRFIENINVSQIHHIPRVLYHWRSHAESTAQSMGAKPYAEIAGVRALNEHFERQNIAALAEKIPAGYKINSIQSNDLKKVSLIIPTKAKAGISKAVRLAYENAEYPIHEIILVGENALLSSIAPSLKSMGNEVRISLVPTDESQSASTSIRSSLESASGDYICMLSGNLIKLSDGWLKELMLIGAQDGVGCVGGKVIFKNNRIKHAGYILCPNGSILDIGYGGWIDGSGYCGRAGLTQQFLAVSSELLLFKKSTFQEISGENSQQSPEGFLDVDFCLRLREMGKKCIWTPFAQIYLNEKYDFTHKSDSYARDVQFLLSRWGHYFFRDPYFNPNLSFQMPGYLLSSSSRN